MPPEWAPHQVCLMAWPAREAIWGPYFAQAKADYAEVARAIAAFEPVLMVCNPGAAGEVHDRCGEGIEALVVPIDDSWMRDSGPIFVSDGRGGLALVDFGFNAWGEKFHPYDNDARVPRAIAAHLGMRRYEAPFVLEGGSFFVDGEGTLITTEQCLLNPNRNPDLTREQIEDGLRSYLGVETVVWIPNGMAGDRDTDGHIDGVAQYVRAGTIVLLDPADPSDDNAPLARANLERLHESRDVAGRTPDVLRCDVVSNAEVDGTRVPIPYLNCYLANGAVIMPSGGEPEADHEAMRQIGAAFPDREVVAVPGAVLSIGGGGPHCITQQVPVGTPLT
jgi:agmatine deiminase